MSQSRVRLSKNFRIEEFDCHDGTRVPTSAQEALRTWCVVWGEPLRERFGPVRVTSGFRTRTYNASVGGAASSYHRYDLGAARGVAADVVPARGTPADWEAWARSRLLGRLSTQLPAGRGAAVAYRRQGFVHLDTGPTRTWVG